MAESTRGEYRLKTVKDQAPVRNLRQIYGSGGGTRHVDNRSTRFVDSGSTLRVNHRVTPVDLKLLLPTARPTHNRWLLWLVAFLAVLYGLLLAFRGGWA